MVVLREARASDVERLIDVARRSWLSAFAQNAPFSMIQGWARKDWEAGAYPKYWPDMLVAVAGQLVVGLVYPKLDEINGLWVAPSHQRQGFGSALLRVGEEKVRASGFERAWLTCSSFNPNGLAFYRARGYAEVRRIRETLPCGATEDEIVFERFLP